MIKIVKVGITNTGQTVAIKIALDSNVGKFKTVYGGTIDNPMDLYIYGSIKEACGSAKTSSSDNMKLIKSMLENNEFAVLFHKKEYIEKYIDIWEKFQLNKYRKHCVHQDDAAVKGTVCRTCGHIAGDNVLLPLPEYVIETIFEFGKFTNKSKHYPIVAVV